MIAKASNIFPCWLAVRSQKYECSLIKTSKLWFQTKERLLFIPRRVTTFLLWPRNFGCIGRSKAGWDISWHSRSLSPPWGVCFGPWLPRWVPDSQEAGKFSGPYPICQQHWKDSAGFGGFLFQSFKTTTWQLSRMQRKQNNKGPRVWVGRGMEACAFPFFFSIFMEVQHVQENVRTICVRRD